MLNILLNNSKNRNADTVTIRNEAIAPTGMALQLDHPVIFLNMIAPQGALTKPKVTDIDV